MYATEERAQTRSWRSPLNRFNFARQGDRLGRDRLEEALKVGAHVRIGVLLDEERGRGVAAEEREEPVATR
jgi:hypothetical protein